MTREEAIECLNFQNVKFFGGQSEALKMAILALSENKGKWIKDGSVYRCSNCKHYPMGNIAGEKFENLSRLDAFYFCPHCGADMREPKPIGVFKCLNDSVTGKCIQDLREPKGEKGKCSTCKNSDDKFSGECYECVKNIQNHYEPKESEE